MAAPPQDLLTAAEAFDGDGADIEILLNEKVVEFDGEGRKVVLRRLVYEVIDIDNASGWGEISASWAPWYQERPEITARIIGPGGSVSTLDPNDLVEVHPEDGDDPVMYSDLLKLRGPLPNLVDGAVVERVVVVHDHKPFSAPVILGGQSA